MAFANIVDKAADALLKAGMNSIQAEAFRSHAIDLEKNNLSLTAQIKALKEENAALLTQNTTLRLENEGLRNEIKTLRERLNQSAVTDVIESEQLRQVLKAVFDTGQGQSA